jgi:hypothetical protein
MDCPCNHNFIFKRRKLRLTLSSFAAVSREINFYLATFNHGMLAETKSAKTHHRYLIFNIKTTKHNIILICLASFKPQLSFNFRRKRFA